MAFGYSFFHLGDCSANCSAVKKHSDESLVSQALDGIYRVMANVRPNSPHQRSRYEGLMFALFFDLAKYWLTSIETGPLWIFSILTRDLTVGLDQALLPSRPSIAKQHNGRCLRLPQPYITLRIRCWTRMHSFQV